MVNNCSYFPSVILVCNEGDPLVCNHTNDGNEERGIGGSCHVVDSVRKEKERLTAVSTSKQRFGDSSSTIPTLTLNHPSPMLEEGLGDVSDGCGGDEGSVCKVYPNDR